MPKEIREKFLAVYGWAVKLCLGILWVVLVFAPESVLERLELRIAVSIVFAVSMVYSWLKKTWQPESRPSLAVKGVAAGMIAVLLLRLLWIAF